MIRLTAYCRDCRHKHKIKTSWDNLQPALDAWSAKHKGHRIGFKNPPMHQRDIEAYSPNADVKLAYGASAAYTITLAALPTSATLVAGQESTEVSNASNKYADYIIGGKVTVGTTPTTLKVIEIWAVGTMNDAFAYPDVFDGTDSAETVTSVEIKYGALGLLGILDTLATSDVAYWLRPTSLLSAFNGALPQKHSLFVVHNTAVNLNATGGNHVLSYQPVYNTVI